MEVSKQEMIKIGVTVALLVTAITISMTSIRGTVAGTKNEALHDATLHCFYDNGTHQYGMSVNFTFYLHNGTDFPEVIELYDLGDNLTLRVAYSPKVQVGYNKQLMIRATVSDINNDTVTDPSPSIGNFSVDITSGVEDGLALTLPASSLEGDYSCLLYTSPSPRDATLSRMPSSA